MKTTKEKIAVMEARKLAFSYPWPAMHPKNFWYKRTITTGSGVQGVAVFDTEEKLEKAMHTRENRTDTLVVDRGCLIASHYKTAMKKVFDLPWPAKRKWWRCYIGTEKLIYGCEPTTNICRDNVIDTVDAYTEAQAMAEPWKRKVKKTVNAVVSTDRVGSARLRRLVLLEEALPEGTEGTFTYTVEEIIK